MDVLAGSTDVTTYFHLEAAAGGDATGLTIADLDLQYVRSGAAPAAKVDATALAATDTAHTDNYGIQIDATDQPGLHRFDWPDAAFASGVREVVLTVKGAAIKTCHLRVNLTAVPANVTAFDSNTASATAVKTEYLARVTGAADSGTTTTMVDSARTEADDFWNGQLLVFTSGPNAGLARVITDFVAGTDTASFDALPNAVASGHEYEIVASAGKLTAAEVNAEVLDVLNTDTFAEPTGVPAATTTLAGKIGRLYQALRNKVTTTATKKTFYDDADAALWEKDLSDDATTYTETEANSI